MKIKLNKNVSIRLGNTSTSTLLREGTVLDNEFKEKYPNEYKTLTDPKSGFVDMGQTEKTVVEPDPIKPGETIAVDDVPMPLEELDSFEGVTVKDMKKAVRKLTTEKLEKFLAIERKNDDRASAVSLMQKELDRRA